MFIKRVKLHAFGKVTGTCELSTDKCNVICQENEFGKTTLVDAILYSFFNFPTRGNRGELKAKDRYKPWFAANGRKFEVELDLQNPEGRNLRLHSNFTRQQPFELTDTDTRKSIPLEGVTFGQQYLRMPLQSFTECFFFRQDDRDTSDDERDSLIQTIEEAAVSNQKNQDASVRNALNALNDCKLHYPEFSAGPITLDNVLKNINKKLGDMATQLADLQRQRDEKTGQIGSAEKLDAEIDRLHLQINGLEQEMIGAELADIEGTLRRQEAATAQLRQRQERLNELSAFAQFDPSLRPQVQALYTEWDSSRKQLSEARAQLDDRILEPLRAVERDIASFADSVSLIKRPSLERLRSLRMTFSEQRDELVEHRAECERQRQALLEQGVPLDETQQELEKLLQTLSPLDRRILMDFDHHQLTVDTAIAEAEARHSQASTRVAESKTRRERLRMISSLWFVGTVLLALIGLLFILMKLVWPGAVWVAVLSLLGAAGCASIGFLFRHRTQSHSTSDLEPAMGEEISSMSEVNKLRGKLETLRGDFDAVLKKRGLLAEDVKAIKQMATWAQTLAPYRASCDYLSRIETSNASARAEIVKLLEPVARKLDPAKLDEMLIDTSIHQMEHVLDAYHDRDQLNEAGERLLSEIEDLQQRLEAIEARLEEVLSSANVEGDDLITRVVAFLEGCENAVRLMELTQAGADFELLPADKIAALRDRCVALHAKAGDKEISVSASGNPAELQERVTKLHRQREELRLQRANTFAECDRVVERWRREGPELEAEIERLEKLRGEVADFKESLAVAHRELSLIAEQVFSQWAGAINERVNEVLAEFNSGYREVEFSDDLELSVYSAEAGRRLVGREIQHLSKGARDQLNMAVRIAISEYLSAHVGNLPLVFDEPFAHWDDKRFGEGMRFLTKLSQRHQVIVLTCHQWRYRELQRAMPHLAQELKFCTVEPEVAVGALQ